MFNFRCFWLDMTPIEISVLIYFLWTSPPRSASQSLVAVVQLTNDGCGVNFLKHCIIVTYHGRVVLQGAKGTSNKLLMERITNEKPATGPGSQSNMLFESANCVTTDQWQNMRENGSNFGQNGQFLGNIVQVPN